MVKREKLNSRIILRIVLSEDEIKYIVARLPEKIGEIDEKTLNFISSKYKDLGVIGWEINMFHNSNSVVTPSGDNKFLLSLHKDNIAENLDNK